jgi:hypothetical protein
LEVKKEKMVKVALLGLAAMIQGSLVKEYLTTEKKELMVLSNTLL